MSYVEPWRTKSTHKPSSSGLIFCRKQGKGTRRVQILPKERKTHTSRWQWLHCQLVPRLFFDVLRRLQNEINALAFVEPKAVGCECFVNFLLWRER